MTRQWRAAGFWLRDQDRVTIGTWFSAKVPPPQVRRVGVLVLQGIGHEEEAVAVGVPEIAGTLAAGGLMAMSIELSGNGQSLDALAQPEIVPVWCRQIEAAIEYLRKSGAEKIAVFAPRFTAALALITARKAAVDAVVLCSPIFSGASLRARAPHDAGGWRRTRDSLRPGGRHHHRQLHAAGRRRRVDVSARDRDLGGDARARDPLPREPGAPHRRSRDSTPARARRRPRGSKDLRASDWMFTATDNASVPYELARVVAGWIDERFAGCGFAAPVDPRRLPTSTTFKYLGREIRETFVSVGELGLSGVLVEPLEPDPTLASVLYLSMGPGRSFVNAARQSASEGRSALRFDFAGFGLSPMRPTQSEPELYGATGGDDVRLAVEHLRARGSSSVVVVGFCAGAWSSVASPPIPGVVGIAAINVHLSVRLRKAAERSKNNSAWQRDLRKPGQRTLFTRLRDRVDRLPISAGPPIGWLTAHGKAGASVGLFFDSVDVGFQYWDSVISGQLRRQLDQGSIRCIRTRAWGTWRKDRSRGFASSRTSPSSCGAAIPSESSRRSRASRRRPPGQRSVCVINGL